jgi:uncharacterized membrane protein YdjX (TVP38/TMEM64 family)
MAEGRRTRLIEFGLVATIIVLIPLIWAYTPVFEWLTAFLEWVRGAGALGVVTFVLAFALSGPPVVSAELMMAASGFLFGPVGGTLAGMAGALGAFVLNLLLARTVLRERLQARWSREGSPLAAFDHGLANKGLLVVLLLRLPPLSPFHIVSYGLGLSRVRMRDAVIGTVVGSVPQVAIFAWLGSTVSQIDGLSHASAGVSPAAWAALIGVTVALTAALTWIARRELKKIAEVIVEDEVG